MFYVIYVDVHSYHIHTITDDIHMHVHNILLHLLHYAKLILTKLMYMKNVYMLYITVTDEVTYSILLYFLYRYCT